jgi:hypothetical protein
MELAERLAARNTSTLAQAQATRDNAVEPLMSDEAAELAEWAENLTRLADDIYAEIGRAERAAAAGQLDAARDMLTCAARLLGDME